MFKRIIRWILPLIAFGLIALSLVLSLVVSSHAAGPATPSYGPTYHSVAPHNPMPNWFWHY